MIRKLTELYNTAASHFFTSAIERCDMSASDYDEREFLFEGTANIYRTGANGKPEVQYADCEYTNRMSLRLPRDQRKCSGRVVVEIVNSTANFDIDRVWAESYRYIMRHGDIFVGITSKANVFTALRTFDERRYGTLNWPNPSSEPVPQDDTPPLWTGPQDQETGYIWDILKDVSALLRDDESDLNPLMGWKIRYVYLTGWSQSCSYITTFVSCFESPEDHAYDGYFSSGGVHRLWVPLNRYESVLEVDGLKKRLRQAPAPFIELNTESEASDEAGMMGYTLRSEDSDDPDYRYRYFDIAGGCHDSVDTCMAYNAFDDDIAQAIGRHAQPVPGDNICRNNYRKFFAFHVALQILYRWAEDGLVPPHFQRMLQSSRGIIRKDAFGNSLGGLRTPMMNYPVCTYYHWSDLEDPATGEIQRNVLAGHEVTFSVNVLKELYGDLERYRMLVTEDAERLVCEGHILREDMQDAIEMAVSRAAEAGLL